MPPPSKPPPSAPRSSSLEEDVGKAKVTKEDDGPKGGCGGLGGVEEGTGGVL